MKRNVSQTETGKKGILQQFYNFTRKLTKTPDHPKQVATPLSKNTTKISEQSWLERRTDGHTEV